MNKFIWPKSFAFFEHATWCGFLLAILAGRHMWGVARKNTKCLYVNAANAFG